MRIEGATYCHGSALSIHIGASLHDVLEGDEDDDYKEDEEEEDNDVNNDNIQGETPKDEDNGEEEDDEDNTQFVDTLSFPNIELGASRLNKTNKSPP